jgi:ribonuclease-3
MRGSVSSSADFDAASLEERLGHRFAAPALLKRALSHASMGAHSNERLEFLGDRVLGLVIAQRLHAEYPGESEGGLAVRLNALVRREACAQVAERVALAPHLIMAAGEAASGGRKKSAILAGAVEAVIAALYIDGGFAAAEKFILSYWEEAFATLKPELRDAKTALQEWAQSGARRGSKSPPVYAMTGRTGPDHAPAFRVEVRVAGQDNVTGEGATKRDAEQDAARRMLQQLGVWTE